MNEEKQVESIKITFEICMCPDVFESEQNTLVLLLQSIFYDFDETHRTEMDLKYTNRKIDRVIEILKGLKYIDAEGNVL